MVKVIKKLYLWLIFIFLYAPVVLLAIYSFNASKTSKVWGGFTLSWYKALFQNQAILTAFYYTIIVGIAAMSISTILGTMAAIGIYAMKERSRQILLNINYIPVMNPDIVMGLSMMLVYAVMSIRQGFFSMLIAHVTFCAPYVVLTVLPKLNQMNENLIEAALDLGASPFKMIRSVVIPQIMPGILTGAVLAFTLSIDDFVVSYFTSGSGVTNLSIYVYSAARRGISPEINALSTIMILFVFLLLLIVNIIPKKKAEENRVEN